MFKRGGFAMYTKTGRNIELGRRFGAAMARGSKSDSKQPMSYFGLILFIMFVMIIFNGILKAASKKQQ
jgi:hypothetical protein